MWDSSQSIGDASGQLILREVQPLHSSLRLVRFPNSFGISPVNWFTPRSRKVQRAGWRGSPTPSVSHPSTGSPIVTTIRRLARLPKSFGISPVNWFTAEDPGIAGWRGSPTPSVSHPSTGCYRGTALAGWRGSPTPSVSHPSTGCFGSDSCCRLARFPNSAGISPVNWLLRDR